MKLLPTVHVTRCKPSACTKWFSCCRFFIYFFNHSSCDQTLNQPACVTRGFLSAVHVTRPSAQTSSLSVCVTTIVHVTSRRPQTSGLLVCKINSLCNQPQTSNFRPVSVRSIVHVTRRRPQTIQLVSAEEGSRRDFIPQHLSAICTWLPWVLLTEICKGKKEHGWNGCGREIAKTVYFSSTL